MSSKSEVKRQNVQRGKLMNEGVQPKYKAVKHLKPFCPKCDEMLIGNNSLLSPYRCSCGIWKPIMGMSSFDVESVTNGQE